MLLLIMIICVYSKTFKSFESGKWSSPNTWGSSLEIPKSGDKVIISNGHNVTVDIPSACGLNSTSDTSLTINGILSINSDLNVNGITKISSGTVNQAAGTTLLIEGNFPIFNNASSTWNINGKNSNRSTIRAKYGNYWWFNNDNSSKPLNLNWQYADLIRMGNSKRASYINGGNSNTLVTINHCKFDTSAAIYFGYDSPISSASKIQLTNNDWRNCQHTHVLYFRTAPPATQGNVIITDNSLLSRLSEGSRISFVVAGNSTDKYIDFKNNILKNIPLYIGRNTVVDSCFIYNPSVTYNSLALFTSSVDSQTIKNTVGYATGPNSHLFDATSNVLKVNMIGNVTISSGEGGNTDNHYLPTSFNGSWDILRCIAIGNQGIVSRNSSYVSGTINIDRFTHIGRTNYDALLINEDTDIGPLTKINVTSCLEYSLRLTSQRLIERINSGIANDFVDYTDYNNIFSREFSDRYYNITMTSKKIGDSGFGMHDKSYDPKFIDSSASFEKFDKISGGDSTVRSMISNLMKINGFDTNGIADTSYNSNYSVGNILHYFRDSFTPQNQALDGTGYNGTDIGAVDFGIKSPAKSTNSSQIIKVNKLNGNYLNKVKVSNGQLSVAGGNTTRELLILGVNGRTHCLKKINMQQSYKISSEEYGASSGTFVVLLRNNNKNTIARMKITDIR